MITVPNAANLRQRMIEEMQLRRFSERSIESYLRAVSQLAGFCWKSPDLVSDEELRDYFLFLRNPKRLARATTTIAPCGIKLFFTAVLKRDWTTMVIPRPRAEHKRPVVLSVAETWRMMRTWRWGTARSVCGPAYPCPEPARVGGAQPGGYVSTGRRAPFRFPTNCVALKTVDDRFEWAVSYATWARACQTGGGGSFSTLH